MSNYYGNPYSYSPMGMGSSNMGMNTNPYSNTYMQNRQPLQPPQPQQPQQDVLKVNGRNGMEMLNMSPNSSVLALDINKPILWFGQTDGAGYKTITAYQIVPINDVANGEMNIEQMITQLEQRISKLEEGVVTDGQSNTKPNATKRTTKSNGATGATE